MKQNSLKRLFSYSWKYKWSFLISIFGFILFASADIAAVEWIRQIIGFINDLSLIHISETTIRTPISYAVFCLKKI